MYEFDLTDTRNVVIGSAVSVILISELVYKHLVFNTKRYQDISQRYR